MIDGLKSFLLFLLLVATLVVGVRIGVVGSEPDVRRETVIFCIQSPKDCKTEFDFYQIKIKNEQ